MPTRSDAVYCSHACKQRAYRERQHVETGLKARSDAARALVAAGEIDPWDALYLVVAPTAALDRVTA